jgi:hypothetical protein
MSPGLSSPSLMTRFGGGILAVAFGFVVNTFIATPGPAIVGTLLIGAGVPVYFIWKKMG